MHCHLTLVIVALISAAVARGDDPTAALAGIIDLTSDNFEKHVGKDVGALVEFMAPWCGHCKNLVPELAKLGKAVKGKESKVIVGKVNADDNKDLTKKFGVSGYPTIKFFPAGSMEPEEYNSGRDAEAFVEFLNKKTDAGLEIIKLPSAVATLGATTFDDACLDATKDCFTKFYAPWCGHCKTLAPKWEEVAAAFAAEKEVVVADVDCDKDTNKDLCAKYKVEGFPTLKFFPKENKEGEDYSGGRNTDDLIDFINDKTGLSRGVGGDLVARAGTTLQLNALASAFFKDQNAGTKKSLLAAVEAAGDNYKYYAKVVTKMEKDAAFPEKENTRLKKMLAGGSIKAEKREEMSLRKNVCAAFIAKVASEAEPMERAKVAAQATDDL